MNTHGINIFNETALQFKVIDGDLIHVRQEFPARKRRFVVTGGVVDGEQLKFSFDDRLAVHLSFDTPSLGIHVNPKLIGEGSTDDIR